MPSDPDFIPAEETPDFIPAEAEHKQHYMTPRAAASTPDTDPGFLKGAVRGFQEGAYNTIGKPIISGLQKLGIPVQQAVPEAKYEGSGATGRSVGHGVEQVAEMEATGGPLRSAATGLASKLPAAAKIAGPLLRVGAEAANTGANAAIHGQPIKPAIIAGAGGAGLGEAASAIAPKIAESALGVTNKMRGYGRTVGKAALEETSGIRPATIARQAGSKLGGLTGELESEAGASATPVSVQPAIDVVDNALTKARGRNAKPILNKLQEVREQLMQDAETGQALPITTTAKDILERKRGIGDLVNSWSIQEKKGIQKVLPQVYHAMDAELDRAVPGADKLNQRISSLIPVKSRASIISNNSGITQRALHRAAAHTGALAGAVGGGYAGYERGGTPGAIIGGTVGLVTPEILSSTAGQMAVARYGPGILARSGRLLPPGRSILDGEEDESGEKK